MSFFDDASLVMIPSGYKTSKVYSVKPTDGTGDLAFTRSNDTASRVASNGLIEKVRTNALLQSNSFDTTWTTSNASVTGGQSGYDGSSDAWKLESSTNATESYARQTLSLSGVGTMSIYAKAGNVNFIAFYIASSGPDIYSWFNLSTGATGSGAGEIDKTITSVGGGWYRVTLTGLNPDQRIDVYAANANGSYVTDSGEYIYIQDAQLEAGDIATDYIATTSAAVSVGPVANVPRLDYLNSSCPRLLLEPQRTNSVTSSENISTGWTYTNTGISVNQTDSPDGYVNADSIIPDATSGQHAINSANITASGSFTLSAFVKAGEYTKVAIRESANTGSYASFNLATGTKIEDNVSGASFIQSYGNGWYRIGVTGTYSGTIRLGINVLSNAYTTGNPSSGTTFFSGNASDKLFCWGMQAELGATYATSYIPTLGSASTRGSDAASKTGISSLIGSAAGTIYVEFSALVNDLSERRIALSDGTTGNVARVGYANISNRILAVLFNGANQCVLAYDDADITQTQKVAFTWAANDFALFVNGVKRSSDVSGTTIAANTLTAINFNEGDGAGNDWYGDVDQLLLFKSRLSDSDLAALTA